MWVVQLWLTLSGNAAYAEYFSDVVNAIRAEMQAQKNNTWLGLQERQHNLISASLNFNTPPSIQIYSKNA